MAIFTSKSDQRQVYAAALRAGGYSELVRLTNERQAAGGSGHIVQEADGKFNFVPEPAATDAADG